MLFGALLETTNLASMALRTELGNRGVDVEPVLKSCREYLGTRTSYADYLRDHHPYRPPKVQLPPYAPDEPRTRRPPKQAADEPPDLVGITAEVDAFAYLIASMTLTPPLAIGLFGDWGSGKSYFLRSVQRRIDQLVSTEADQWLESSLREHYSQLNAHAAVPADYKEQRRAPEPAIHDPVSQVRTSLSTSSALPSTRRSTSPFPRTLSGDVRFRQAKQSRLNPSM